MKKQAVQIKGGACVNTIACNLAKSDNHNERKGTSFSNTNIDLSLTPKNYVWKASDIPDLTEHDKRIRDNFAKTARHVTRELGKSHEYYRSMPSSGKTAAHPIKESILSLPQGGEIGRRMTEEFVERVENRYKVRAIRIIIHEDEVFTDPFTGKPNVNIHAHIVWDFYEWTQHRLITLKNSDFRAWQDIAAYVTGMPRGTDARLTGAKHLMPPKYKIQKEIERASELKMKNEQLETKKEQLETIIKDLEDQVSILKENYKDLQLQLFDLCGRINESQKLFGEGYNTLQGIGRDLIKGFNSLSRTCNPRKEDNENRDSLEALLRESEENQDAQKRLILFERLLLHIAALIRSIDNLTREVLKNAQKAKRIILSKLTQNPLIRKMLPKDMKQEYENNETMKQTIGSLVERTNSLTERIQELETLLDKSYDRNLALEQELNHEKERNDDLSKEIHRLKWESGKLEETIYKLENPDKEADIDQGISW